MPASQASRTPIANRWASVIVCPRRARTMGGSAQVSAPAGGCMNADARPTVASGCAGAMPPLYRADDRARPDARNAAARRSPQGRSEEHPSELQSLMRTSYAVLFLKKKIFIPTQTTIEHLLEHLLPS